MLGVTTVATAVFLAPTAPALAAPYFNKTVRCKATDPEGRVIPTRIGNSILGWNHFSGRHNLRNCKVVNAAIRGRVDRKENGRLEYWGVARRGHQFVDFVVVVQYTRKTKDQVYDAGKGQKIGVITAYCKRMSKCPDWMNR